MTGLALTLALLLALGAAGRRFARKRSANKRLLALPGMQPSNALPVASFDEIEAEVSRRRCPCGGRYSNRGESTKQDGDRRLRVVALECRFCEERLRVFFDLTRAYH